MFSANHKFVSLKDIHRKFGIASSNFEFSIYTLRLQTSSPLKRLVSSVQHNGAPRMPSAKSVCSRTYCYSTQPSPLLSNVRCVDMRCSVLPRSGAWLTVLPPLGGRVYSEPHFAKCQSVGAVMAWWTCCASKIGGAYYPRTRSHCNTN
jgi:hypothetical protein